MAKYYKLWLISLWVIMMDIYFQETLYIFSSMLRNFKINILNPGLLLKISLK